MESVLALPQNLIKKQSLFLKNKTCWKLIPFYTYVYLHSSVHIFHNVELMEFEEMCGLSPGWLAVKSRLQSSLKIAGVGWKTRRAQNIKEDIVCKHIPNGNFIEDRKLVAFVCFVGTEGSSTTTSDVDVKVQYFALPCLSSNKPPQYIFLANLSIHKHSCSSDEYLRFPLHVLLLLCLSWPVCETRSISAYLSLGFGVEGTFRSFFYDIKTNVFQHIKLLGGLPGHFFS